MNVLVLGGTAEARALATALVGRAGTHVTTSLAGRVAAPAPLPGEVRVGGFGGVDGLARWLATHRVDTVVDATHPFAATMTAHAVLAAARCGVPLLVLRRPGWTESPGDDWRRVADHSAAAAMLPTLGARAFLTTGRHGLASVAHLDGLWFLVRSVDPPVPPVPARMCVVLGRGPFTPDGERALMRRHRIDVLVTRDSGGEPTFAKLVAARELGIPVVMLERPPSPAGVATVTSVGDALGRLGTRMSGARTIG